MIEAKVLPSDKKELLDMENYEVYNRDLLRKVFPRIIAEHDSQFDRKQRKPQIRDIIALYYYLLSYVSGVHTLENGSPNPKFGAAFPAVKTISADLGIAEKRIRHLADILEANGLLRQKPIWDGKLYFMSYCPRISDDGYIVNGDGEKVMPDKSVYIRDSH